MSIAYSSKIVVPRYKHLSGRLVCYTTGGKTLPIEVIPVATGYDNNRSQYLGGGLTGPVAVSSIQAMQSII